MLGINTKNKKLKGACSDLFAGSNAAISKNSDHSSDHHSLNIIPSLMYSYVPLKSFSSPYT
jgi:hypothetical protein